MHKVPGYVDQFPAHTDQTCQEDYDESNDCSPLPEATKQLRKRHSPNTMVTAILQCHPPHHTVWPPPILVILKQPNTQQPQMSTKHMPMPYHWRLQDNTHDGNGNRGLNPANRYIPRIQNGHGGPPAIPTQQGTPHNGQNPTQPMLQTPHHPTPKPPHPPNPPQKMQIHQKVSPNVHHPHSPSHPK